MFRLRSARRVCRREGRAAINALSRRDDQQVSVEADSEPRLPLRVGEVCERFTRNTLLRQFGFETVSPFEQVLNATRRRSRARHLAGEVHDRLALLSVSPPRALKSS